MKVEHKKRLLGNFFSLSVLQILNYALPLLTLPYLVRVLDIDTYGIVVFAQSFIIFINIFVDWGFNLSATKDVSIYRDDKDKLTEIYSSVVLIKLFLTFFSFLFLYIVVYFFDKFKDDSLVYFLSFLWVVGQALFPVWYFQGIEKMKYITLVNIISKVGFTLCIFIFVSSNDDYLLVPLFNGLGSIIASLFALWFIRFKLYQKFKLQKISTLYRYFIDSSQFFLSRVSLSLYTSANAFILGLISTPTIVGYYGIAEQLYKALQAFYTPLSQVLYPYIAKERNVFLFKKIFLSVVVVNFIGIVILFFIDNYLFDFLFGNKVVEESLRIFEIFLLAAIIVVPSILLGYPFLGALGYAKYANLSVIYASIIHILGLFLLLLTGNINMYNVAYMVLVTEVFVFIYRVKKIRSQELWKK